MRARSPRAGPARSALVFLAGVCALALPGRAHAEDTPPADPQRQERPEQPLLTGKPSAAGPAREPRDLLVFKSTVLFNEFVYRALLNVPRSAKATPELARRLAGRLATFLREAGYELATVRTQVVDGQIAITVDEGQLDKVILIGVGADTKIRFRLELNLPQEVFNRPQLEQELPRLARRYRLLSWSYELWPTAQLEEPRGLQLGDVESLSALPFFHGGRAYELRIFASTDGWGQGFAPELNTGGVAGLEAGGRFRWRDLLLAGDRVEARVRAGVNLRSHLVEPGSRPVLTHLLAEVRYFGPPFWAGAGPQGLRPAVTTKGELWTLQRQDLGLEDYAVGTAEAAAGIGAHPAPAFDYAITLGVQRRWLFDVQSVDPVLDAKVAQAPAAQNRGFLSLNGQYVLNPGDLRTDQRNRLELDLRLWGLSKLPSTFLRVDAIAQHLWKLAWNELWLTLHVTALAGSWSFLEEEPLGNHLRVGFGGDKYTQNITSLRSEFRYSLLRDIIKASVFTDLAGYLELPDAAQAQTFALAGASGLGLNVLAADQFQCNLYAGVGWSTTRWGKFGVALQIKEAF